LDRQTFSKSLLRMNSMSLKRQDSSI
jgi:hypothetical protein